MFWLENHVLVISDDEWDNNVNNGTTFPKSRRIRLQTGKKSQDNYSLLG